MAHRNVKHVYKEGADDFDFLMLRVNARNGGKLEVMLRQTDVDGCEPVEASDPLAAIPDSAFRRITREQFRAALDGIVAHLRGKAGIV